MPRLSKKKRGQIRKRIKEGEQLEDILSRELPKHFFYLVSYMNDETKEGIAGAYFREMEVDGLRDRLALDGPQTNYYMIGENLIKNLVDGKVFHGFSNNYLNEEETKKVYKFLEDNL